MSLLLLCYFGLPAPGGPQLSPRYREWLEDVSPIITQTEREIFSKLKTDSDREKFIRFFWKERDPLPDTAENEFYKEYMERIRFADQTFGRGTSRRGSRTERGYFYLLLGKPLERTSFATQSQIWPLELWFYKGEVEYGLPPYFYLIFFQPQGLGEYRLYSPGTDGPESLVVPTLAVRTLTRANAYQIIKMVNSELAGAALSYLPGEQSLLAPEISSTSVMASIRSYPEKKFSDAYARDYMAYKDYITTEYTDRFVSSSFAARVYRNAGQTFVHWTLEPAKINFVSRADRYQAVFDVVLRLEDQQGNLVLEKTEEVPLSLTADQYKAHERQRFAFQDLFPVIPGQFRLFGLLKNKTAQDFSSFSAAVRVPAPAEPAAGLLLYLGREKMADSLRGGLRAYAFGGEHYLVNAQNEFPPQAEMGVFVQLPRALSQAGMTPAAALVEVADAAAGSVELSRRKSLADAIASGPEGFDLGTFPLAGLKPGYYTVSVAFLGGEGQKVASAGDHLVLLSQAYPVMPWIYSRTRASFPNSDSLFWLGTEHYLSRQYEQALAAAEKARSLRDEPRSRLLAAQSYFALGRYDEALSAARPLADAAGGREAAKVMAAAYAARRDWSSALGYLEKLLAEATEVSVLNLAGECYIRLGQPEKGLPLLQKSLEMNADQPAVKDLERSARAGTK